MDPRRPRWNLESPWNFHNGPFLVLSLVPFLGSTFLWCPCSFPFVAWLMGCPFVVFCFLSGFLALRDAVLWIFRSGSASSTASPLPAVLRMPFCIPVAWLFFCSSPCGARPVQAFEVNNPSFSPTPGWSGRRSQKRTTASATKWSTAPPIALEWCRNQEILISVQPMLKVHWARRFVSHQWPCHMGLGSGFCVLETSLINQVAMSPTQQQQQQQQQQQHAKPPTLHHQNPLRQAAPQSWPNIHIYIDTKQCMYCWIYFKICIYIYMLFENILIYVHRLSLKGCMCLCIYIYMCVCACVNMKTQYSINCTYYICKYTRKQTKRKITLLRVIPTMAFNSSHLTFCLANLSGILFGILFEILSGISSGILSGISSGILSGISSDILSGISIWHSIWHVLWHSIWHIFWHSINVAYLLTFYLAYLLTFYLEYLLTFYLAFYLAFHLACLLTFYLAYLLTFYQSGISSDILSGISSHILSGISIWHSIWHVSWHSIWHTF